MRRVLAVSVCRAIRDWVLRFNAGGRTGSIDVKASGRTPKLKATQRRALSRSSRAGPIPAIHGVVRWRLIDLVQWISEEYGVSLDETTVGRSSRRWASASSRRVHVTTPRTSTPWRRLKKLPRPGNGGDRDRLKPGVKIELWFQDECRIGQKNKITRRWARARHTALRPARPAHPIGLHLRRYLSQRARPSALFCRGATARRWTLIWPR